MFDRPAAWRFEAATALGLEGEDLVAGLVTGAGYPDALAPAGAAFRAGRGPVADLGAGLGAATAWIRTSTGLAVVGVEPEWRAACLGARAGWGVPMVAGTATAAPLRSGGCGGIALLGVVSLLDELADVLAEVHRLLRIGGVLAISDLCAREVDELRPEGSPNVFRSADILAVAIGDRFDVDEVWRASASHSTVWDEVSDRVDAEIGRRHAGSDMFGEWSADRDRMGRLIDDGALEVATLCARLTGPN